MSTFKNLLKTGKPPSGRYDYEDLKRLFEILNEINKEVQKYEFDDVCPYLKEKNQNLDEDELRKEIEGKLLLRVGVFGDDGFYKVTSNPSELSEGNLPKRISKVTFENTSWYKTVANREPLNTFQVTMDFNPPPVWDLISSPSSGTSNQSAIQVLGDESTWVEGSFNKIKSVLSPGWSMRSFIHAAGAYDILIWLLVVPAAATYFASLEKIKKLPLSNISPSLMSVLYLVGILMVLLIFRILFNVIRSGFPVIEYADNKSNRWTLQKIMRWILGTSATAVIGWIAVHAVSFLIGLFP